MKPTKPHPFHLVHLSPWPLSISVGAILLTLGIVKWFHYKESLLLILGLIFTSFIMTLWWRDVIRESTFIGHHTKAVQNGLRIGIILFIISEVAFFIAFFWAFFHSRLRPAVEIGAIWPPAGIYILNPLGIPLLNTATLLISGATVTIAHYALLNKDRENLVLGLNITVILGVYFFLLQLTEYRHARFGISDSVFGSTFFITTGFHGFHVFIGTAFLRIILVRRTIRHFSTKHHKGLEFAIWYWHFVDVVWILLYIFIYWWSIK